MEVVLASWAIVNGVHGKYGAAARPAAAAADDWRKRRREDWRDIRRLTWEEGEVAREPVSLATATAVFHWRLLLTHFRQLTELNAEGGG